MSNLPWSIFASSCIVLACIATHHESHAQLVTTSDTPGPISQLLQLVWEPSSLIRVWSALDQMYNIVLGWRSAARTVVHLPFRMGRSMDHVRIQEPRRFRLQQRQKSDLPHLDRFNKVYAESSNVVHAPAENVNILQSLSHMHSPEANHDATTASQQSLRAAEAINNFQLVQQSLNAPEASRNFQLVLQQLLNNPKENFRVPVGVPRSLSALYAPAANRNVQIAFQQSLNTLEAGNAPFGSQHQYLLPPPFLFRPQEVFSDYKMADFKSKNGDIRRNVNIPHPTKLLDSFVQNGGNIMNEHHRTKSHNLNVPLMFFNSNPASNSNPEARLRMFLKLMGKLGEMHKKSVNAVQFDDDVDEESPNEADH